MVDILYIILAVLGWTILEVVYPFVIKALNDGKFPSSYSNSYKILYEVSKKLKKHLEHIFSCWTMFNDLALLPALLHYSTTLLSGIIAFISLGSLAFVGLFPISIKSEISKIHCIFAKLCAVCALLWLVLEGYLRFSGIIGISYIVFALVCFVWAKKWQEKYETLIMEFVAFTLAYSGVILKALGI